MASQTSKRNLTKDRIVAQAGAIVRTEGVDALTMRRLADACGVTPMALYHHVSDKDEVLGLVLDEVMGEILALEVGGDPHSQFVEFMAGFYRAMVANSGVGEFWVSRGITVPNMSRITERLFEMLSGMGIEGQRAAEALDPIVVYTVGGVAYTLSRPPGIREELVDPSAAAETPLLADLVDVYAARDPESQFVWGLERLLDGIVG